MKAYFIGDACLCWPLGRTIRAATSARVLRLYESLKKLQSEGELPVTDIVPSYNALVVYFDPVAADVSRIRDTVQSVLREADLRDDPRSASAATDESPSKGKQVVLPVQYDGEDLDRVATHTGLAREEVIRLHAASKYTVAMIGFLPHFPYLIGLSKRLCTPRLATPRFRVPAGAVAIGGAQTGVYPCESPGGWNLIGCTDPALLMPLEPGDRVVFEPS
jgi:KipI family sensor histidine kinase inhibitor